MKIIKYWGWILLAGFVAWYFLWTELPDNKLHLYFLDIGQGDAVLVKTPENHLILIDGGPDNSVIGELGEVLPFFTKTIDMIVLTHPHDDHLSGLVDVLRKYEVKSILFAGSAFGSKPYQEFLQAAQEEKTIILTAESGRDFRFGKVFMDVIYPIKSIAGKKFENINNASVSMKISYNDKAILLTGDLEEEGEKILSESGTDLKADIYKAGHHGSKTSSNDFFLREIAPEIVVISAGKDNRYGHPDGEVLEELAKNGVDQILRTDLNGRVEIVF